MTAVFLAMLALTVQAQSTATPIPEFPADIVELVKPLAGVSPTRPPAYYPEKLTYEVKWGLVSAGQATLSIDEIVSMNGRPAYHITSTATSGKFVDKIHKVRDLNESWMDVEKGYSLGYLKRLREGRYVEDSYVIYDHENGRFISQRDRSKGGMKQTLGPIPPDVQDVLSSMYYLRRQKLEVGKEVIIDVNTGENWPMVVKVHRKETVKVPAGKFECFVVQPLLRKQGIFITKGKDMFIWLADDEYKTPVQMKVEVFIGHISANLVKVERK